MGILFWKIDNTGTCISHKWLVPNDGVREMYLKKAADFTKAFNTNLTIHCMKYTWKSITCICSFSIKAWRAIEY